MMIGDDVNDAPALVAAESASPWAQMARRHQPATALPFLTRASWVTVIELCTSDEHDAAQLRVRDVAKKYLERRGARCRYRGPCAHG